MSKKTVFDCTVIYLPQFGGRNGHITFVNNGYEIPYEVKRVFYLYDIPGGEARGSHAHKKCHQFLVAASGAFEVLLDDGRSQRLVQLNRPSIGLHIPQGFGHRKSTSLLGLFVWF